MDYEEACTKLQTLSIIQRVSLSEDSLKHESKFKDNVHVQLEDMFVETEDSHNTTNIAAFTGSDVTPIINKSDSSIPSESHVSRLTYSLTKSSHDRLMHKFETVVTQVDIHVTSHPSCVLSSINYKLLNP